MTDRFNFYDIYGYVLPGIALQLCVAILIYLWGGRGAVPNLEVGSAVIAAAAAFIIGTFLHELARRVIPSQTTWGDGPAGRLPSDWMTDPACTHSGAIQASQRQLYQACVARVSKLGVDLAREPDRTVSFNVARNWVLQKGTRSYADQYQGMQALHRGLAVALWLAGWASAALALASFSTWCVGVLWIGAAILLVRPVALSGPESALIRLAAIAAATGGVVAWTWETPDARSLGLICFTALALLASWGAAITHDRFAVLFVRQVVDAFLLECASCPESSPVSNPGEEPK